MTAQVTENMPAKNVKVLNCHGDSLLRLSRRLVFAQQQFR
jgi:hypothetical protein